MVTSYDVTRTSNVLNKSKKEKENKEKKEEEEEAEKKEEEEKGKKEDEEEDISEKRDGYDTILRWYATDLFSFTSIYIYI